MRIVPQLSDAVTVPQFLPSRLQKAASASGAQQLFGIGAPAPSQICVPLQLPQLAVRMMPQLSAAVTVPQLFPRRAQKAVSVSFVQPHTFGTLGLPPPQVCPVPAQVVPQLIVRLVPQSSRSVRLPQFFPRRVHMTASVSGVQQLFGCEAVAGSQTWAPLHTPQLLVR
jgi:hypothetical protein